MKLAEDTTLLDLNYKLPDGTTIRIGNERFLCAEALFKPSDANCTDTGFHVKIYDAINKSPIDVKTKLMQNIILTGGTTMFPGLSTRLDKELRQYFCDQYYHDMKQVNKTGLCIHDPPRRKHNVFIGASFLASRIPA